jgi:hypothetical protein
MIKVNLYEYYSFGYNYYILLNNSFNKSNKEFYEDIVKYAEFISQLDLKVTKSSLNLQGINEAIYKLEKLGKGRKKNEIISEEIHNSIIKILEKTDSTLDAELNIKIAFLNDSKRVSNELLTDQIDKLFGKEIFIELPEIAQYDFSEAGKCLTFDRFTACGFHCLRGTEAVLKLFYEKILNKTATETLTWGNFHQEIEANINNGGITPKPSPELMINLNSLRMYYRNKTQHPQLIYNSDNVQDLLFLCIKTVNEMIGDLLKRGAIIQIPF